MTKRKKLVILLIVVCALFLLSIDYSPRKDPPVYGASFSKFHTDELKLDWKQTFLALLNDLGVRHFRFSAHWPLTEPQEGKYNFSELDYQIKEADNKNATYILAIGRRLPGWPECHEPDWAKDLNKEDKQEKILKLIEALVQRYKSSKGLLYWQVENEPFLTQFSRSTCGALDTDFLEKEIELVKTLDSRPVLLTDSGEFGTWFQAYSRGDVFGTSLYLYVWPRSVGFPIRYPLTPGFFRLKHNILRLVFGAKPSFVVELSTEPWLLQPIIETPIETQLERMGIDKFNEMINFSSKTGFDAFYLWGAEWWYWLKQNGHPEHWERAQKLFTTPKPM